MFSKLIEKTIGAMRHVIEKHGLRNYFPVGFSVVFYNPNAALEEKWFYDMRVIIDEHSNAPYDTKVRERINMVNEFLAEGIKKILEGEMDELMVDQDRISDTVFQVPGLKGRDNESKCT